MMAVLFKKALAGDIKAAEFMRDTAGQKPIDRVENTFTDKVVIDFGND